MPLVSEPSPSRASNGSGVAVWGSFSPAFAFWSAVAVLLLLAVDVWSVLVVAVLL